MIAWNLFTSFFLLAFLCTSYVNCLTCYECINGEVPFIGSANPDCENPSPSSVSVVDCDKGSCAEMSGKVDLLLMGSFKVKIRGCMDLGAEDSISGCQTADSGNIPLEWLTDGQLSAVEGEVCYCNTDFCVAQPCDGGFIILNWCVLWWYCLIGGAVFICLITGCCCCCCRCCRSGRNKGVVIHHHNPITSSTVPYVLHENTA